MRVAWCPTAAVAHHRHRVRCCCLHIIINSAAKEKISTLDDPRGRTSGLLRRSERSEWSEWSEWSECHQNSTLWCGRTMRSYVCYIVQIIAQQDRASLHGSLPV